MSRRLRRRRRRHERCHPTTTTPKVQQQQQQRPQREPPACSSNGLVASSAYSSSFDMTSLPSTSSAAPPCVCVGHCDIQRSSDVDNDSCLRTCTDSVPAPATSSSSSSSSSSDYPKRMDYSHTPSSVERPRDYALSWLPSVILCKCVFCGLYKSSVGTGRGDADPVAVG